MTNIKETIEGLKGLLNPYQSALRESKKQEGFVYADVEIQNDLIKKIQALSHAIKICQAIESTGEELEKRKHEKGCKYWAREHSHDCDCGSEDYNDAIDIARPILAKRELFWQDNFIAQAKEYDKKLAQELAKAKLRIEELEKEAGRIQLGMGDDFGDDPVAVIDTLKTELQSLKDKLMVGKFLK